MAAGAILMAHGLLASRAVSQADQAAKAVIEGGADEGGHHYAWTLSNRETSPIIRVTFPHYRADLFTTPPGWKQECTYLVNFGVADRPGRCTAGAPSAEQGIPSGGQARFEMRIAPPLPTRGLGRVEVELADGRILSIPAELPLPAGNAEKFLPVAAGGVVILILVALRMRRGRGRPHGNPKSA